MQTERGYAYRRTCRAVLRRASFRGILIAATVWRKAQLFPFPRPHEPASHRSFLARLFEPPACFRQREAAFSRPIFVSPPLFSLSKPALCITNRHVETPCQHTLAGASGRTAGRTRPTTTRPRFGPCDPSEPWRSGMRRRWAPAGRLLRLDSSPQTALFHSASKSDARPSP